MNSQDDSRATRELRAAKTSLYEKHVDEIKFEAWPKIYRFRLMIVSEKIDGTNAAVGVSMFDRGSHAKLGVKIPEGCTLVNGPDVEALVYAQSRKRRITPEKDNFGFAKWVAENAYMLAAILGPGKHFGEWWGQGIQRGYGLNEKRFSLFNTSRWEWLNNPVAKAQYIKDVTDQWGDKIEQELAFPSQLGVVPVLLQHEFSTAKIDEALEQLENVGSVASPGFKPPEGVVVFEPQSGYLHKKTLGGDEK